MSVWLCVGRALRVKREWNGREPIELTLRLDKYRRKESLVKNLGKKDH
jgi:hypothetical protein